MTEEAGSGATALDMRGKYKRDSKLELNPSRSSWEEDANHSINSISNFPYLKEFVSLSFIAYKHTWGVASSSNSVASLNMTDLIDVEKSLAKMENSQHPLPTHANLSAKLLNGIAKKAGKLMDQLKMRSKSNITEIDISKVARIPKGFEFHAEATNSSIGNGYYGIAYINKEKKQIIVSHRGTKLSNLGALNTDLMSIWLNLHTSQVSSAMTFAHEVNLFARKTGCQLFFTGHSLGAWLAQITCFSTKYLTVDENTGHFVKKPFELWDDSHPYTVVFDSPGAFEFLLKMKDDLFPRNDPLSQGINVSCLPVEIYQFYPNTVNKQNIQIGSVYLIDLDKAEVKYSYALVNIKAGKKNLCVNKPLSKATHSLKPLVGFIAQNGEDGASEDEVLRSQVIDFRIRNWDDFLHKWEQEGRSIPVNLSSFPEFFLTKCELEIFKKQKDKKDGGCYEGLCLEDEEAAHRIVEYSKSSVLVENGMMQMGVNVDRREIIPLLRHFTVTLRNERIWWNPEKPKLSSSYIERRVCIFENPDSNHEDDTSSSLTYDEDTFDFSDDDISASSDELLSEPSDELRSDPSDELLSDPSDEHSLGSSSDGDNLSHREYETMKLIEADEKLILLVNPPGMGKSTEITHLEQKLRKKVLSERTILRINLNEVQSALSTITSIESASNVLRKLAPFLPRKALETKNNRIFVLLDGLDEVCPKHENTMLNLLRILRSDDHLSDLRIVVSTRPHLREAVESEFQLKSWSLVPLTIQEQIFYMQNTLNLSTKQLRPIWDELPQSIRSLLRNPLMLFMLIDVLKSGRTLSSDNVNIYDLYSSFVGMKHKLHLVEKEKMGTANSSTEIRLESMLERNLCFYFHIAWNQLYSTRYSYEKISSFPPAFEESIEVAAHQLRSRSIRTELLTYGLVLEHREKGLVFKHRSLAEYFYSRLLMHKETSQLVRDFLFGYMYYMNNSNNVEVFLAASFTKKLTTFGDRPKTTSPILSITIDWILFTESNTVARCIMLKTFTEGELFPLLVHEVLLTFVRGGPKKLWAAFLVLVNYESRKAFTTLFEWMNVNREFSRDILLNRNESLRLSQQPARLIVAIAVTFEGQLMFSAAEVRTALESCSNLISTVASIRSNWNRIKWDFVESHLGANIFRELVGQANDVAFFRMFEDAETAWKLFTTFSRHELLSLVTKEESRVTDLIGNNPRLVFMLLGEEFLKDIAKFRGKFGKRKAKTVFELDGYHFAVDYLFQELVKEAENKLLDGSVTVAIREAILRESSCGLLELLEGQIKDMRLRGLDREDIDVIEWVVNAGGFLWETANLIPLEMLPFVVRYSGCLNHVQKVIEQNQSNFDLEEDAQSLLESLILASHSQTDTSIFPYILQFIKKTIEPYLDDDEVKKILTPFLEAKQEELKRISHLLRLVSDISVKHILLQLTLPPTTPNEEFEWTKYVKRIIEFTPSRNLSNALNQLITHLPNKDLKEILLDEKILNLWLRDCFDKFQRATLFAFYLDVFGLNLEWVKKTSFIEYPVEPLTVLETNPQWTHLVPQFEQVVREEVSCGRDLQFGHFGYSSEWEWKRLQNILREECLPIEYEFIDNLHAIPLLRVLINSVGVEETRKISSKFWENISLFPFDNHYSIEVFASILHLAIELGEFEAVEKLSWPSFLSWKDQEGRDALDVAKEKLEEDHPITLHLQSSYNLLKVAGQFERKIEK